MTLDDRGRAPAATGQPEAGRIGPQFAGRRSLPGLARCRPRSTRPPAGRWDCGPKASPMPPWRRRLTRDRDPAHARHASDMALRGAGRHPLAADADRAARPDAQRVLRPEERTGRQDRGPQPHGDRTHASRWPCIAHGTEIAVALAKAGIPAAGQRLAYLMMSAELDQVICSGPRRGKQFTYALLDERAATRARPAARRGARRADTPLLHQSRAGDAAGLRLVVRPDDERCPAGRGDRRAGVGAGDLWRRRRAGRPPRTSSTRRRLGGAVSATSSAYLLPIYDEYLIAYKDRRATAAATTPNPAVATIDGYAHWLIVDGLFSGTWRRVDTPDGVEVSVALSRALTAANHAAVAAAARRYGAFLGSPVVVHGLSRGAR